MDVLPLFGYGEYPMTLQSTAYLQLYDRTDRVIPMEGGNSTGWKYISLDQIQGEWANIHGCDSEPTLVATPFDGGKTHNECFEFKGCATGRRVMRCLDDGGHGSAPCNSTGSGLTARMVTWFF